MFYPDWSVEEYRKYLEFCVEIINHALGAYPRSRSASTSAGAAATARTPTTSS